MSRTKEHFVFCDCRRSTTCSSVLNSFASSALLFSPVAWLAAAADATWPSLLPRSAWSNLLLMSNDFRRNVEKMKVTEN